MIRKIDTAFVNLWGETVGAVTWVEDRGFGVFEYDPDFLKKGLNVSPIHMSLKEARKGDRRFLFPSLSKETFLGLPGMLADALPDKFGNSIMNAWLARKGRNSASFSPVERLCYIGKRGMGALEFSPTINEKYNASVPVEVSKLVELTQGIMNERKKLNVDLSHSEKENAEAIKDILRVGTSAGGARPKAIIAMNREGNILSGQTEVPKGYDYWILKFDGVTDLELGKPRGYGRIEYAYHLMAKAAGIHMTECRLLEENGRAHFMTKRFDRIKGKKLHMQSLCGIGHYDFNMAGAHSYEQAFATMHKLKLSQSQIVEQYRRMLFNVIARDLDDHTKNISFLMGPNGEWKLSPAYDVIYSHNPHGQWTNQHQMSLNGKRDHYTLQDLIDVGLFASISHSKPIIQKVINAVLMWPLFAKEAGIKKEIISEIGNYHRVNMR